MIFSLALDLFSFSLFFWGGVFFFLTYEFFIQEAKVHESKSYIN